MDDNTVQTEIASQVGAESIVPTEVTTEVAQPQPSPEDVIAQKVSEATKAIAEQAEAVKRELQSVKDKSKAEIEKERRRAQIAEETLSGFHGKVSEFDPEVAKDIKLAEYESKERAAQTVSQAEGAMAQQREFDTQFNSQINQFITGMGVDPSDKKIDWGEDAPNYLAKQQRVLDSVVKIQKANQKASEEKHAQVIKDVEAKIRKDLGLDSVDTSNPVGVTNEQAWLEKWGNGDIEATPQNLKKAMTLQRRLYAT